MHHQAAYLTDVLVRFEAHEPEDDTKASTTAYDTTLVARLRAGDVAAFEELILTVSSSLEGYARRFVASVDIAEDVVQDVLAHLWEHRNILQVRGSLRSYLYSAVRNRAFDIRRHDEAESARWTAAGSADTPAGMGHGAPSSDVELERQEIATRLTSALDALPPRAREAALLRWVDGLSRPEIATIMGVAVPTVNNQLTIAARTVRALLADLRDQL